MGRLFILVLAAPFWVHFLLAGGCVWLAKDTIAKSQARYDEMQRLATVEAPLVADIGTFEKAKGRLPQEVNLRAQIASDHKVRLVKKTNGVTTGERIMYILSDPDAKTGSKVARGAIIIDPDDNEAFAVWVVMQALQSGSSGGSDPLQNSAFGDLGPVLAVPGLVDSPSNSSHAHKAIKNQGFTEAKNFVFIEPFLKGRVAGLAVTDSDRLESSLWAYSPTAVFTLIGLFKLVWRRKKEGKVKAPPATSRSPLPTMDAAPSIAPSGVTNGDFIGSLKARQQQQFAQSMAAPAPTAPLAKAKSLLDRPWILAAVVLGLVAVLQPAALGFVLIAAVVGTPLYFKYRAANKAASVATTADKPASANGVGAIQTVPRFGEKLESLFKGPQGAVLKVAAAILLYFGIMHLTGSPVTKLVGMPSGFGLSSGINEVAGGNGGAPVAMATLPRTSENMSGASAKPVAAKIDTPAPLPVQLPSAPPVVDHAPAVATPPAEGFRSAAEVRPVDAAQSSPPTADQLYWMRDMVRSYQYLLIAGIGLVVLAGAGLAALHGRSRSAKLAARADPFDRLLQQRRAMTGS